MKFRVYDKKRNRWTKDSVLLTSNGELMESTKTLFGNKLTFMHQDRYVFQQDIGLNDKDGTLIYIGDYLEAQVSDDKTITGLVTFAEELCGYIILSFNTDEYYTLSTEICDKIKVVGNVFDEFYQKGKKDEQYQ